MNNQLISNDLVYLLPVEEADLSFVRTLSNLPAIRDNLFSSFPYSLTGQKPFLERLLNSSTEKLLIVFNETHERVGVARLQSIDYHNQSVEIGLDIHPNYWRQGYGVSAYSTLLEYLFLQENMFRIYLHVFAFNKKAINLYKKLGFVQEGLLRKAIWKHGEHEDVILMSILRSEWHAT